MALLITAYSPAGSITGEVSTGASHTVITVTQLRSMLNARDFVLVNVHVPYAGEIEGTNLFIPYNEMERNLDKLPADQTSRIIVYCRSGMMSDIAARTLARLGFTNVVDVRGGMAAWVNEGYQLVQKP